VVLGCFVVLRPFVSSLLWAGILCYSTWPFFSRLEHIVRHRRTLAAAIMTMIVSIVLLIPFAIAGLTLTDNLSEMTALVTRMRESGVPAPPDWIGRIPLVGKALAANWQSLATDSDRAFELVRDLFARSQGWLLRNSIRFARGVLELALSVFIAFFFYRNGEIVANWVSDIVKRLAGENAKHLMQAVGGMIRGVVYGILGTALAQGVMATVGLRIAGVPSPLLLGLATFLLSFVPGGPPLVWAPAAIWLLYTGQTGWAIFMGLWGFIGISGVDNLLRPYLISRGAKLPFVVILLGVMGGILAFGFLGLFLGPTLLAAGSVLLRRWMTDERRPSSP
jgi:predicted PurR-regulated permease PerM